jgi:hypothetical protein
MTDTRLGSWCFVSAVVDWPGRSVRQLSFVEPESDRALSKRTGGERGRTRRVWVWVGYENSPTCIPVHVQCAGEAEGSSRRAYVSSSLRSPWHMSSPGIQRTLLCPRWEAGGTHHCVLRECENRVNKPAVTATATATATGAVLAESTLSTSRMHRNGRTKRRTSLKWLLLPPRRICRRSPHPCLAWVSVVVVTTARTAAHLVTAASLSGGNQPAPRAVNRGGSFCLLPRWARGVRLL